MANKGEWRYKAERRQLKIEELEAINRTLNDKVMKYRNLYEQARISLKYNNSVISDMSKTLLTNTVIDKLRSTLTNAEWRKYILKHFN